jgi:hypothetical protein
MSPERLKKVYAEYFAPSVTGELLALPKGIQFDES